MEFNSEGRSQWVLGNNILEVVDKYVYPRAGSERGGIGVRRGSQSGAEGVWEAREAARRRQRPYHRTLTTSTCDLRGHTEINTEGEAVAEWLACGPKLEFCQDYPHGHRTSGSKCGGGMSGANHHRCPGLHLGSKRAAERVQ
ncbi:hypothetical protein GWK47_044416 [Chionoecetes opilio]|uniref:Uncharacterized protein n=1 Tax=Chionoecetes opilio TaxID=41210 RepID=A0A8J4Y8D6_CHIOP|nr:hypothetical protein GWK47_044416 [Chionoecetes opilio]